MTSRVSTVEGIRLRRYERYRPAQLVQGVQDPGCLQGDCPKHRFSQTHCNEPGLQYFCAGYKKFFLHIRKYCHAMTQLLENGLPASYIMDAVKGPLLVKLEEK